MMTTQLENAPIAALLDFERAVLRIQMHPTYGVLPSDEQDQIDAILRFARTSPDREIYTARLIAALDRAR